MFNKPDIIEVLISEGIELKRNGRDLWALCPLHSEKTASFKVDPERQSFHCFGCGSGGGDAISFIQQYKGLSFKEALQYLGISNSEPSPEVKQKIRREKLKRNLVKEFQQWVNKYHDRLCFLYKNLQKAKLRVKTIEEAEALAKYYHLEPIWEYHLDILEGGDDMAKIDLFMEVTGREK
ncbi:MAG: hypothetical protein HZC49_07015 [Nitrospirae bacterium]|nr:hypothetical protein [Nitrospirota bacterium]